MLLHLTSSLATVVRLAGKPVLLFKFSIRPSVSVFLLLFFNAEFGVALRLFHKSGLCHIQYVYFYDGFNSSILVSVILGGGGPY